MALSLALTVAACGGDDEGDSAGSGSGGGSSLSGDLNGAGASSQQAAMQAWAVGFQDANPDITVNYDAVGSGGGREQFLAGGVLFAGSDAYLDEEELTSSQERCAGDGGAIDLPHYISPIAVVYNLPSVPELQLSPATVAKIFNNQITTWNDPAIAADNPDAQLPSTPITAVHRADDSGTTENFIEYLVANAEADFPYEPDGVWPAEGGEAAQQTSGVIQAVTAAEGAIGYADLSQAGELGTAALKVGEEYVAPSPEGAATALEASALAEGRPEGDLAYEIDRTTTEAGAYPLFLVSYHVVCKQYESQEDADKVKAFMTYVGSEEGQQAAAQQAGSAPISEGLREQITEQVDAISAAG
ncbi:phosphate ABC transporter substrate-binding protein PstS [Vallicoccus soli]|uniref:Phosphate-binding protein n=1 Tax=Vallicoccus soli TaxID=2339232 RepID=A0A3A3ZN96_9ACTN|nr:phosphate ABC transporter substrate-binding protein PstS [Vallicoccus soli]